MKEYKILNRIESAKDIKNLTIDELKMLADEIRMALFNKLSKRGGHFGSNFGVVELEIAMHYVFDSPNDKFIFDVSHQTYPHKILTGRKDNFIFDDKFDLISGYTNPLESEHDIFKIGHTSTSISLASGIAKSRDLKKENFNVVAVIGDGSLSGGEAMEGLNVVGSLLKSNFILIINDNDMFVADSCGSISENLKLLRETKGSATNNIFKSFGFDYLYEENGNDLEILINDFKKIKNINHPIAFHINTIKGYGYDVAINDKEAWHWCYPFDIKTGNSSIVDNNEYYFDVLNEYVMKRAKFDDDFLLITPSYPCAINLTSSQRKELGSKYIDVGIAEEHAIAMASGAAKNGSNVLVTTDASFFQRVYDQVAEDLCLNNSPATLLSVYSFDGIEESSHLGIFSQSIFQNIPNLLVIAPTSKEELLSSLDFAINQKEQPVMIFVPRGVVYSRETKFNPNKKYVIEKSGSEIVVFAVGGMFERGVLLLNEIKKEFGISATLINPLFISEIDIDTLNSLKNNHKLIITLEDCCKCGGFGEKIADYFSDSSILVKSYGIDKNFYDIYDSEKVFDELDMTNEKIIEYIKRSKLYE